MTFSRVLVASSVENWGILRGTVLRKKGRRSFSFQRGKETITDSETFFSGMACDDFNTEAVFAEQEEMFLPDSNID